MADDPASRCGREAASPACRRMRGASRLYALLSMGFDYPSAELGLSVADGGYGSEVEEVLAEIGAFPPAMRCLLEGCRSEAYPFALHELRREHTRLFLAGSAPVALVGAKWPGQRSAISCKRGEEYAVGQFYQELGLGPKPGVRERLDSLVSELDFMAYAHFCMSNLMEEGRLREARQLGATTSLFIRYHFCPMALGVAAAIPGATTNAFYLLQAELLNWAVVERVGRPGSWGA